MSEKTNKIIKIIRDAKSAYSEDNIVLAIPKFMSKHFTSFCSMREDLLLIKQYIQRLDTETDLLVKSSFTYSAISLYGKCFTDASKVNAPKLEANQLFKNDIDLKKIHEYLMDLRHHFISHRGDTEGEVEVAYLLIPKEEGEPQVRYSRLKQMSFSKEQQNDIMRLADYLLEEVIRKIQKSGQKTYDAFFKNFTPDLMTIMALNNMRDD